MKPFHQLTFSLALTTILISCNAQDPAPDQSAEKIAEQMVSQIKTSVDPAFEYEYSQTKFVPPAGKSLLIMGQTLEDINDYMSSFSEEPIPGGWSAYWGIPEFKGITTPHRNETGSTQDHQMLVEKFPNRRVIHHALILGEPVKTLR